VVPGGGPGETVAGLSGEAAARVSREAAGSVLVQQWRVVLV
jgi:hypothetical protein